MKIKLSNKIKRLIFLNKFFSSGLFLILFIFISSFFANPAFAIETGRIGAYPTTYDQSNPLSRSWLIYSLPGGDNKEDKVTVVNNSDEIITVKVYAVDATTTKDGAFALFNEVDKRTGVGSWVKLSESQVTLKPKDRKEISFTISIPKDITIGDHAGGIIFQEVKPKTVAKEGININIISRVGVRIYETVPGAQQLNLEVKDFQHKIIDDKLLFSFKMENKGNVFLSPKGSLEVKDAFNNNIEKITLDALGTVVPGKPTTIQAKSKITKPILGHYTALLRIDYGAGKVATQEISFFIVNWIIVAPVLIVILIILLIGLKIFLKRKYTEKNSLDTDTMPDAKKVTPQREITSKGVTSRHSVKLIAGAILLGIIGASVGFAFFLQNFSITVLPKTTTSESFVTPAKQSDTQQNSTPAAIDSTTEKNKPIEKNKMKVIVLNGTGQVGLAKKVAEKLTNAGFTIIKIGNAESKDYTKTIVQFPNGQVQGAGLLVKELKDEYKELSKEELKEGTEFIVIVGLP